MKWKQYHRGHLINDREFDKKLARRTDGIMQKASAGKIIIAQRRHGPDDYSYLMKAA